LLLVAIGIYQSYLIGLSELEADCLRQENQTLVELRQMKIEQHNQFVDSLQTIINRKNIPTFEAKSFAGEFYNYLKQRVHCPDAVFTLAVLNTDYFRDQGFRKTSNPFPVLNVTLSS